MRILQKLTLTNLRQNKRRTIVTIVGVMLSSALILAVVGMVTSMRQMMINFAIDEFGDYHDMFQEVPAEKLKYISENQHVAAYFYSEPITKDSLPENIDEDVLETYVRYQHAPYPLEMYHRFDQLPEKAQPAYNIYVRYDRPQDYEKIREQILATLGDQPYINVRTNSDLLHYEAAAMNDATLASLISLAAIVIGIIVVTSIFVIRNSFSISATERARQFGMLSSVGATPQQIRTSVLFEGLVIGAIGVPLGILLGVAAVVILVLIMNTLLSDMVMTAVPVAMPWWIFPIAILLSFVTIFLSSLIPAIRAAKLSPIEAIRGNKDIKLKAKKLRTSKLVRQTFGIGGVIAQKNLKRSRKKYRTTVISIVLSVATFIGLYSFISYGQDMVGLQYQNTDLDLVVYGGDQELYHQLITKFDLQNYAAYERSNVLNVNLLYVNQDYFAQFAKAVGVKDKDLSRVAIMNDYSINEESGHYKIERQNPDLKDGGMLQVEAVKRWYDEKVPGENIIMRTFDEKDKTAIEIPITKLTDQFALGYENYYGQLVFVADNYYLRDQLGTDESGGSFYASDIDRLDEVVAYLEEVQQQQDYQQLRFDDINEVRSRSRRIYLLISIFLYGFVAVVTLIGVTNIFNTITTNIALRAKEFAMLKSVGMTGKEFNRMVRLESLLYASKALVIGIPLGLLLSYGFYDSIAQSVDFGYRLPWMAIIISVVVVGALIGAIMHYSVKQVEKQNIIETIRNENI